MKVVTSQRYMNEHTTKFDKFTIPGGTQNVHIKLFTIRADISYCCLISGYTKLNSNVRKLIMIIYVQPQLYIYIYIYIYIHICISHIYISH